MPYIKIPKDISGFKPKYAFGLTLRQMIAVVVAIIFGIGTFYLLGFVLHLPLDIASWAIVIVIIPSFIFGFVKKDGLPIEKYLFRVIRKKRNEDKRRYKTQNMYEMLQYQEIEKEKRTFNEAKKRKK